MRGSAELIDADNNVIWSSDKHIVLIGVKNLVVVEGPDAISSAPGPCPQQVSGVAGGSPGKDS